MTRLFVSTVLLCCVLSSVIALILRESPGRSRRLNIRTKFCYSTQKISTSLTSTSISASNGPGFSIGERIRRSIGSVPNQFPPSTTLISAAGNLDWAKQWYPISVEEFTDAKSRKMMFLGGGVLLANSGKEWKIFKDSDPQRIAKIQQDIRNSPGFILSTKKSVTASSTNAAPVRQSIFDPTFIEASPTPAIPLSKRVSYAPGARVRKISAPKPNEKSSSEHMKIQENEKWSPHMVTIPTIQSRVSYAPGARVKKPTATTGPVSTQSFNAPSSAVPKASVATSSAAPPSGGRVSYAPGARVKKPTATAVPVSTQSFSAVPKASVATSFSAPPSGGRVSYAPGARVKKPTATAVPVSTQSFSAVPKASVATSFSAPPSGGRVSYAPGARVKMPSSPSASFSADDYFGGNDQWQVIDVKEFHDHEKRLLLVQDVALLNDGNKWMLSVDERSESKPASISIPSAAMKPTSVFKSYTPASNRVSYAPSARIHNRARIHSAVSVSAPKPRQLSLKAE